MRVREVPEGSDWRAASVITNLARWKVKREESSC